jgi:predicted transcriptional regulator
MAKRKITFTLDDATITRVEMAAASLTMPKSEVVREAIHHYFERMGKLSEVERLRMLRIIDAIRAQPPTRDQSEVDRELREIRRARRSGGRRTPVV